MTYDDVNHLSAKIKPKQQRVNVLKVCFRHLMPFSSGFSQLYTKLFHFEYVELLVCSFSELQVTELDTSNMFIFHWFTC